MSDLKVLVTDGHYKHALAIVRSLGQEDAEVHVGSHLRTALSFYSKYASRSFLYPNPVLSRSFINTMETVNHIQDYDVILPVGNETWMNFATMGSKELLRKVPMPPRHSYLIACNKVRTFQFLRDKGIPIPKTILPTDPKAELADLPYPAIVKPCFGSGNVRIVKTAREALMFHKTRRRDSFAIQEYVRGTGYGFFGLYNKGRLRAFFMHKRIRESPPSGGPSSAAESVYDARLLELGSRTLNLLDWHGVAMVEFKRDEKTGEFKLLEINPKFWGSLDLAIAAGINFPYLAAQMVISGNVDAPRTYNSVRFCWPLPDDLWHVRERPSSLPNCIRDWLDVSVEKNIWPTDPKPHMALISALTHAQAKAAITKARNYFSMRPEAFSWIIPGKLAASAKPRSFAQLAWLKGQGIAMILDLMEDDPIADSWLRRFRMHYTRIPMIDHMPPELPELTRAVNLIDQEIRNGRAVLVHCLGGLGRTGTTLACYLVKSQKKDPKIAISEIRAQRPGSIESEQERSIFLFSSKLRRETH